MVGSKLGNLAMARATRGNELNNGSSSLDARSRSTRENVGPRAHRPTNAAKTGTRSVQDVIPRETVGTSEDYLLATSAVNSKSAFDVGSSGLPRFSLILECSESLAPTSFATMPASASAEASRLAWARVGVIGDVQK